MHTKQVEIELDDDDTSLIFSSFCFKFLFMLLHSYLPTIQRFPGLSMGPGIRCICPGILKFWLAIMVFIIFAIFQSFVLSLVLSLVYISVI